jgi:hypothetical protein
MVELRGCFLMFFFPLYLVCDIGGIWDLGHRGKQLGISTPHIIGFL